MGTGKALQTILKEKNVSVAQLSRETGISSNTLYAIIKRDSDMNIATISRIAKCLGISVDELSTSLTNKTAETVEMAFTPHTLSLEKDIDKDDVIRQINILMQDYQRDQKRYYQLLDERAELDTHKSTIERRIKYLDVNIKLFDQSLKNRERELDILRKKL